VHFEEAILFSVKQTYYSVLRR